MGYLFLIVGPSGAGKDTLIEYAISRIPELEKVTRVITRKKNEFEDFKSVSEEEFSKTDFFITWGVYGKHYGIPKLEPKKNYIINVSRSVIDEIKNKRPKTIVIELFADKNVLEERVMRRKRESSKEVKKRLDRVVEIKSNFKINTSSPDICIAGERLVTYIKKKLLH